MQLVEEPLVTRREILRSLKLGAPTTDAPFNTLRSRQQASKGWSLVIRGNQGRVAGRLQIYSGLNVDAARAVRLRQPELARRLAARASAIERTSAAEVLLNAVDQASTRLSAYLAGQSTDDAWSDRLTRYLDVRQAVDWNGLDREALAREWLARSEAWLYSAPEREEELLAAVGEMATAAQTARAEELADLPLHIDSFTGVVRHIDPDVVEIVGRTEEAWVISRRELDREGLARLGEAVTLIREELPGGGEAWVAAPAADLGKRAESPPQSEQRGFPFSGPMTWVIGSSEQRWLERALRRDPFLLRCSPIRVEPGQ